jgi:hypothetical protein
MFDPVFNLRLDQNWGFVGASFALHDASGGYYGSGFDCFSLTPPGPAGSGGSGGGAVTGLCTPNDAPPNSAPPQPGTPNAASGSIDGHPADKWGWASSVGFTLVNPFGLAGDSLGAQAVYSEGAIGYNTTAWGPSAIYGSGKQYGDELSGRWHLQH